MQKKLIALAVAAAASTGAFAQSSNVQIYGVVDYGYTIRHDRLKSVKDNPAYSKTNSQFDGGQSAGNRIGFKGVEDLGNGLKAVFVLERGFALDTGSDASTGDGVSGFNRQAYVGLSGSYGTVVGGLVYTPYYTLVSGLDPFADGTVGTYSNVKRDINALFNPVRVNNTVAYVSPSWSGFNFTAAYSNNAIGDDGIRKGLVTRPDGTQTIENVGYGNSSNNNVYAIAGNYVAPDWNVGLSYHYISAGKDVDVARTLKGIHNITLGGAYDFKAVKVSAFVSYDKASYKDNALGIYPTPDNKKSISQTNFMLGAVAPFGKHAVKGSVNYSYNSKNQYGKAWQFAVGYDYNFSKRTNFYAAYSYINADKANNNRLGRAAVVGDATNSGGVYKQAFQLGIKHSF